MAGAERRRRNPDRLAWIRRRNWSRPRGVKLRTSSSESDGNPRPVAKPVRCEGDAASKIALKVGVGGDGGIRSPNLARSGHDVGLKRAVEVRDGDGGGSCGPNTGTGGFNRSPKDTTKASGDDDDFSFSPMSGCCCCNENRKHLAAEEGGCEGYCPLNFGRCDCGESPKHGRRSRLRVDPDGQLYVLDSEAEDSALEEPCRPMIRRGHVVFGRRVAAAIEVALEAARTKATAVVGDEMTQEMFQFIEQCLTGIEEANREIFLPWIKVAITASIYNPN